MSQQVNIDFLRARGLADLLKLNAEPKSVDLTPEEAAKILGIPLMDAQIVSEFAVSLANMPPFISEYGRLIRESSVFRNVRGLSNDEIASEIARIEDRARIPAAEAFRHLLDQISPTAENRLTALLNCRSNPTDHLAQVSSCREAWITTIEDIVDNRRGAAGHAVISESYSFGRSGD